MAHIQVEASVRTHKKFLMAGPAASWLWLCGVGYSQDGLTDGFIPFEALPYLGVKAPKSLRAKLVEVGLWDEVDGGWQIHDYANHNRTAAEIKALKRRRGDGGFLGGRPSAETLKVNHEGKPFEKPCATREPNHGENPSHLISSQYNSAQIISDTSQGFRYDLAFEKLKVLYPPGSVTSGQRTHVAFIAQLDKGPASPESTFGRMLSNLANQKLGYQWRVKRMIPLLENWLRDGKWEQEHDPNPPVGDQVSSRTARTLAAAAELMGEES